jgi:hypothetical protein
MLYNPLKTEIKPELCINIKFLPCSKHSVPTVKTNQLMFCGEIIIVCFVIHTKHINALHGKKVKFFNVKVVGT